MFKRIPYLFLILFWLSNNAIATKADSLIELFNHSKNNITRVNLAVNISSLFISTEQYDLALKYANEAKNISESIHYKKGSAEAYFRLGNILREQEKFIESFNILLKSAKLSETIKYTQGIFEARINLGALFIRTHQYDEAESYYTQALSMTNEPKLQIEVHSKLGTIYVAKKNYRKALEELWKVEKLLKKTSNEIVSAQVYGNIGRIFSELNDFDNALKYFKKALDIAKKKKSKQLMVRAYSYLSKLYFNLYKSNLKKGDLNLATNQFKLAKSYLKKCNLLAIELGNMNGKCVIYYDFYELYKMEKNYKEALKYLELYTQLNDSLVKIENNKSTADLNQKYKSENKDKEIKLLNAEKEQKKNEIKAKTKNQKIIIFSSIVFFISITTISVFIFISYRQKQRLNLEKMEKEKIKAELRLLKDQIGPHLMFNYLNTIYFQIDQDKTLAKEIISKFAVLIRYQLYDCNADFVEIEKEKEYLKKFVEIQEIRKSERCKIEFKIGLKVKDFLIAPLLLIPLIENAFKYVTNDKDSENFVLISLTKENNELHLSVKNTMHIQQEKEDYGGIGLKNLENRLQLIYPNKHNLEVSKEKNIFIANLTINVG
ncbi:MAG: tetratricopeptide repeat protein [Bacteroidota bacterium]|jgi:tetratricopeptide (TPR) repeat protein